MIDGARLVGRSRKRGRENYDYKGREKAKKKEEKIDGNTERDEEKTHKNRERE